MKIGGLEIFFVVVGFFFALPIAIAYHYFLHWDRKLSDPDRLENYRRRRFKWKNFGDLCCVCGVVAIILTIASFAIFVI